MRSTAPTHRDREVLDLWERGIGLDRWRRDDALLARTMPPRGLGARNAALLALRNTLFDRAWPLKSSCPACGTDCAFEVDSVAIAECLRLPSEASGSFEWGGRSLIARAPDSRRPQRDLAGDRPRRARSARCLQRCIGGGLDLAAVDDAAIDELGQHLERLDPGALVTFQLVCPACRHEWSAILDVGEALWLELQRSAERTLADVDALARVYGWTEAEVHAAVADPARRLSAAGRWRVMGFLHHLAGMALGAKPASAARPTLPSRFAASPFAGTSQGLEVIDQATPTIPALPARPEVAGSPIASCDAAGAIREKERGVACGGTFAAPTAASGTTGGPEPVTSTGRRFATAVAFAEHRQRGRTPVTIGEILCCDRQTGRATAAGAGGATTTGAAALGSPDASLKPR